MGFLSLELLRELKLLSEETSLLPCYICSSKKQSEKYVIEC